MFQHKYLKKKNQEEKKLKICKLNTV